MRMVLLLGRVFVAACCLAALGACRHVQPTTRVTPLGSGPLPGLIQRIRLIAEPRDVRDDYVHPPSLASQAFAWNGEGGEWRIQPAEHRYSYAGFFFRHPVDLRNEREAVVLSFRLKPPDAGRHLTVALLDGSRTANGVMVEAPLGPHKIWERRGWGLYAIRLDEFPDEGIVLDPAGEVSEAARMDWSDVQGVRIIASTRRTWEQGLRIRDLQFGPIPWAMRFQRHLFAARQPVEPAPL